MTNFSHRLPTPQARLEPHPTSQLTPQTIANKSGIAHKSAKTLKFKLDASLLKIKHGVNKFKLTALRDFCTERFRMPFLERIHPPKAMATTSKVDSLRLATESELGGGIWELTIVGFKSAVKGRSFIVEEDWGWRIWIVMILVKEERMFAL